MVDGQCEFLIDIVLGKEVVDSIEILQDHRLAHKLPRKKINTKLKFKSKFSGYTKTLELPLYR